MVGEALGPQRSEPRGPLDELTVGENGAGVDVDRAVEVSGGGVHGSIVDP